MGKTLNLIPSTEKHRGEEEEGGGREEEDKSDLGGGEGERERGRRGRERASRLSHSAPGLEGLDFRRASTTAARLTCPDSALGLSSSASEKASRPCVALLVLPFRSALPSFYTQGNSSRGL